MNFLRGKICNLKLRKNRLYMYIRCKLGTRASEARWLVIKILELFEPVASWSRKIYVVSLLGAAESARIGRPRSINARVIFRVIHASAGCPRASLRLCAMHDAPCRCNCMRTCSRIDHADSLGQHLREIEWFTSCIATRRHSSSLCLSHYRIRGRSSKYENNVFFVITV